MLDLTMLAFELAFEYRNPVVIAGDGYLGQINGRVDLPDHMIRPGVPEWAVFGDESHRANLINSIRLSEPDLEQHNSYLIDKYRRMTEREQRSDRFLCDEAEWIVVASNTPARIAKGAVQTLRNSGVKAGLFRPITLWPFPVDAMLPLLEHARGIVMVEAGAGQLEDEMRLALSHAGVGALPPISRVQHYGGVLPQAREIIDKVFAMEVEIDGHSILHSI
jgi:pyruvate/2-oxoacid:ferredoxin oxidoreductase alpha subunit